MALAIQVSEHGESAHPDDSIPATEDIMKSIHAIAKSTARPSDVELKTEPVQDLQDDKFMNSAVELQMAGEISDTPQSQEDVYNVVELQFAEAFSNTTQSTTPPPIKSQSSLSGPELPKEQKSQDLDQDMKEGINDEKYEDMYNNPPHTKPKNIIGDDSDDDIYNKAPDTHKSSMISPNPLEIPSKPSYHNVIPSSSFEVQPSSNPPKTVHVVVPQPQPQQQQVQTVYIQKETPSVLVVMPQHQQPQVIHSVVNAPEEIDCCTTGCSCCAMATQIIFLVIFCIDLMFVLALSSQSYSYYSSWVGFLTILYLIEIAITVIFLIANCKHKSWVKWHRKESHFCWMILALFGLWFVAAIFVTSIFEATHNVGLDFVTAVPYVLLFIFGGPVFLLCICL